MKSNRQNLHENAKYKHMDKENKYFWIPVIELAVLAFTTLGTTITLFLHSDTKMNEFRKESVQELKEHREEMKSYQAEMRTYHNDIMLEIRDFHNRLCFIEENRKKD